MFGFPSQGTGNEHIFVVVIVVIVRPNKLVKSDDDNNNLFDFDTARISNDRQPDDLFKRSSGYRSFEMPCQHSNAYLLPSGPTLFSYME